VLKKAGVVAAAAAGLLMLRAPAFASTASPQGEGWDHGDSGQTGLVNVSNVDLFHNVNAVVGACNDNVGVLGAAVPILSPSFTKNCASGGIANG
jgi:hypothetical protein